MEICSQKTRCKTLPVRNQIRGCLNKRNPLGAHYALPPFASLWIRTTKAKATWYLPQKSPNCWAIARAFHSREESHAKVHPNSYHYHLCLAPFRTHRCIPRAWRRVSWFRSASCPIITCKMTRSSPTLQVLSLRWRFFSWLEQKKEKWKMKKKKWKKVNSSKKNKNTKKKNKYTKTHIHIHNSR